ncbi:transmembrane protein, putative [Medicago truncatula]|uniref:Transmembrane protein, putative n=1 Tax=Medicago truncatula TaxID=3880 RepID=G7KPM9_MEDTR|nr:transmembrane protein, putative [Medicago truncatula]
MEIMLRTFLKFVVILAAIACALVGNVQGDTSCCERGEICDPPPCIRRNCFIHILFLPLGQEFNAQYNLSMITYSQKTLGGCGQRSQVKCQGIRLSYFVRTS